MLFLRGGARFLSQQRPIILGEFHSELTREFDCAFLDAADIIQPWDYKIFAFTGRLRLVEAQTRVGLGDVALVPAEKAGKLLKRLETLAGTPICLHSVIF